MAYKSRAKNLEKMKECYYADREYRLEYQRQYAAINQAKIKAHKQRYYYVKREFQLFLHILLD